MIIVPIDTVVVVVVVVVIWVVSVVVVVDMIGGEVEEESTVGEDDLEMLWSDSGEGLNEIAERSAVLLIESLKWNPVTSVGLRSRETLSGALVILVFVVVL